jgi:hypothetical protein
LFFLSYDRGAALLRLALADAFSVADGVDRDRPGCPECVGNPDAHSAVDAPYTRPFPSDCTSPRHLGDDAKPDTGDTKYNKNLHSLGSPGTFVGSYTAQGPLSDRAASNYAPLKRRVFERCLTAAVAEL